ncbi:MAG TPA: peptidoglycan-binding domain-containing protein, partial [Candidatus Paceibacterota bacterium]|nr:peptidoglycan-binding domain-containing protein [Candidatus Paceibacterota bacterium]
MKKFTFLILLLSFLPQVSFGQTVQNCLDLSVNLKQGQKDAVNKTDITSLQNFLKNAGYLNVNATGFFGVQTLRAVKAFQKANNINPTGLVGPLTRAFIK